MEIKNIELNRYTALYGIVNIFINYANSIFYNSPICVTKVPDDLFHFYLLIPSVSSLVSIIRISFTFLNNHIDSYCSYYLILTEQNVNVKQKSFKSQNARDMTRYLVILNQMVELKYAHA